MHAHTCTQTLKIDLERFISRIRGQIDVTDKSALVFTSAQEQIFDHIFTHLGINSEGGINHPVVLTEAVANPNCCRQRKLVLIRKRYV